MRIHTPTIRPLLRRACAAALITCLPLWAGAQVLYDSSRDTTPQAGGWLAGNLLGLTATSDAQGTTVAPTAGSASGYGGYSNYLPTLSFTPTGPQVGTGDLVNPLFPTLDRAAGYRLQIGMQVTNESHPGNNDRAGFSITLIGSDLMGVEIGFQNDRIFAQGNGNPLFTAAESTQDAGVLSALAQLASWELAVQGERYTLSLEGTAVLSGTLRDYSAYTGLGEEAYRTPNFLFVGDNTSSAGASLRMDHLAVSVSAVPEPAQAALLLAGLGVVAGIARRTRRRPS